MGEQRRWTELTALALREARTLLEIASECNLESVVELPPKDQVRPRTGITLLKGSLDCGLAITTLLAASPEDFANPATALQRSQIELYARGVYFLNEATERELSRFVKSDEMPQRTRSNGKKSDITVKELLAVAAKTFNLDADTFEHMRENVWKHLNSSVHGGRSMLALYQQTDIIGSNVVTASLRGMLNNTLTFLIFAIGGILPFTSNRPDEQKEMLDRIRRVQERVNVAMESAQE